MFTRTCALKECTVEFQTDNRRKTFCSAQHQNLNKVRRWRKNHLTMSREDYELIMMALGGETSRTFLPGGTRERKTVIDLLNRLNQGNPNYTPYQVK